MATMKKESTRPGDCQGECKTKGFRFEKFKLLLKNKFPRFYFDVPQGHEFIGPVKVVLVTTPKRAYRRKTWGAAFVVLAFFTIGATSIPIYFFSLSYKLDYKLDTMASLHVVLFTAGFQMLTPAAFLTVNTYNGSSSIIKPRHRKLDYVLLKITALMCIVGGLVASIISTTMRFIDHVWSFKYLDAHSAIGAVAVLLCFLELCTYCCLPCNTKRIWPKCAIVLCIPSFVASGISFVLGLYKPKFVNWLPLPVMLYFFIIFCVYYTFMCIYNPLKNLRCSKN